jgi:hypothetical protein
LVGEKTVAQAEYTTGRDLSDDWSMYTGYQNDIHRSTFLPPTRDADVGIDTCRFGSAHPSVWHMAFCDASVRGLGYDIDLLVHRTLSNRTDGRVLDDNDIR